MQPIDQDGRVDLETIGQPEQAAQAEVAFTSLDAGDEGEVQTNAVGQGHLAQPQLLSTLPGSLAHGDLSRGALAGSCHLPSQGGLGIEH